MTDDGWLHSYVLMQMMTQLAAFFSVGCLRPQLRMVDPDKKDGTDVDIAVTEQPNTAYLGRHPNAREMLLVVEVSDIYLSYDLRTKATFYARVGVREYWVVDVNGRCLHVNRDPTPDGYQNVTVHNETETVSLLLRPDIFVNIADLFPAPEEQPAA